MGKSKGNGNAKYALKNFLMAIGFAFLSFFVGEFVTSAVPVIMTVVGVLFILYGLYTVGETDIFISAIIMGIGAVAILVGNLLSDSNWFKALSEVLSGCFVIFIGWRQRKKIKEHYGDGTSKERLLGIFARLTFFPLFFGGIILTFGLLFRFLDSLGSVSDGMMIMCKVLVSIGSIACAIGSVCWIVYTALVLQALNESGLTINSFKKNKKHSSRRTSSGGVDESKVQSAMESVANYLTGGFEYPYSGCELNYKVTVSVSGGKIDFKLYCKISGSYPASEEEVANKKILSAIEKRKRLVLEKAESKLESIKPDRDYTIYVNASLN
ncbi:MAG: hypothetical protein J1F71_06885 [Clostridiales bacterium]|nr:hypothetical protein [Clostridiales bacterium]